MARKEIHIVPSGKDWAVKRPGADRASSVHPTQSDASRRAHDIGRREHAEVITHGRDGKIRESDSYGNDPCPPRDKH
jgi:uncharacterized protein YdaT